MKVAKRQINDANAKRRPSPSGRGRRDSRRLERWVRVSGMVALVRPSPHPLPEGEGRIRAIHSPSAYIKRMAGPNRKLACIFAQIAATAGNAHRARLL